MIFAVQALRYALARDFKTHRRWALRLFMAVGASLFIRAGVFLSLALNQGPFGFDPVTFSGPFLTFMSFAQYLLPLAVLELYLRAQQRAAARGRFVMAAGIFVITGLMGAGIAAAAMASFLPKIRQAYDQRISIADTLASTIATSGTDQAVRQYQAIKATDPARYNLDEDELNTLGYQLIKEKQVKQAIRIFQLNVDAYPNSANTWDSLGEAYMDDGDKAQAIAFYQHSLRLNPKSTGAIKILHTLGVN
jgi:tetratricopeptide (TPR) repeat protein